MNKEINTPSNSLKFSILGLENNKSYGQLHGRRKFLIGRSRVCDIIIDRSDISALHCVLEVLDGKSFKIYDLDSSNGTFVNNDKIVAKEVTLTDVITIGTLDIKLGEVTKVPGLPPVLDSIHESNEKFNAKRLPGPPKEFYAPSPDEGSVSVFYPLAKDPRAVFSEYIFEDIENTYPIFKYDLQKYAVEIIIVHDDKILSVDYINDNGKDVFLAGDIKNERTDVGFAYLGNNDRYKLVEFNQGRVGVYPIYGHECFVIQDGVRKVDTDKETSAINLGTDDIILFKKGNHQIFVKGSEAPPSVRTAPIFEKDKEFYKYLFILLFITIGFLGAVSVMEVEKKEEEEKTPQRIAKILYKKKRFVKKFSPVKKKKKQAQKSPTKKAKNVNKKQTVTKVTKNKRDKVQATRPKPVKAKTKKLKSSVSKAKTKPIKSVTKSKSVNKARPVKRAPVVSKRKSLGKVQAYKNNEFKSTLSSLLSKSGRLKGKANKIYEENINDLPSVAKAGGGSLKSSTVAAGKGKLGSEFRSGLDSGKGADGILGKKNIYTAGMPSKTVVLGGMDPDIIRKILVDHLPQFRYCYQRELDNRKFAFNGIVNTNFVIGPSGHVSRAAVNSQSRDLPAKVRVCVANVIKGIKFPAPVGGGRVEVKQNFSFFPSKK